MRSPARIIHEDAADVADVIADVGHDVFRTTDNESPTFADLAGNGTPELFARAAHRSGGGAAAELTLLASSLSSKTSLGSCFILSTSPRTTPRPSAHPRRQRPRHGGTARR